MLRQPPLQATTTLLHRDPSVPTYPHSNHPQNLSFRDRSSQDYRWPETNPTTPTQPQQPYALTRMYSDNGPGPRRRDGGLNAKNNFSPEHMLRRKTPNGTLNAGYNGSGVEQPHIDKHQILPASHGYPNGSVHNHIHSPLPIDAPGNIQQWRSPHLGHSPQLLNSEYDVWPSTGALAYVRSTASARGMNQFSLPQLDSMLHQSSLQAPQLQPTQAGLGPYAYMPAAQPAFGPTASGASGPWGPFWPNGVYEPYRPAELRDMRFYPQYTTDWSGQGNAMLMNGNGPMANWQAVGAMQQPSIDLLGPSRHHQSMINEARRQQALTTPMLFDKQSHPRHFGNMVQPGPAVQSPHIFSGGFAPADARFTNPHPQPFSLKPMNTPPIAAYENGFAFGHGLPRDDVFAWAHSSYVELLRYLHELRKRNHGRGGPHPARGHMYPKPPKQSRSDVTQSPLGRELQAQQRARNVGDSNFNSSNLTSDGLHTNHDRQVMLEEINTPPGSGYQSQMSLQDLPADKQAIWQHHNIQSTPDAFADRPRTLRRTTTFPFAGVPLPLKHDMNATTNAAAALKALTEWCSKSNWQWIDGMLLGGCLAYAMADYHKAMEWYTKILSIDENNVEAMSNLAATLFAMNRKQEAEMQWRHAVHLRPSYFEAVEHLIGLLCGEQRGKEAIEVIKGVESALRLPTLDAAKHDKTVDGSPSISSTSPSLSEQSDRPIHDYEVDGDAHLGSCGSTRKSHGTSGSSGYDIADAEVGRLLLLVHAKGNMLYAMGDNVGAAKAFEEAVLLGTGRASFRDIHGLTNHILGSLARDLENRYGYRQRAPTDPILLAPEEALMTRRLCFPPGGDLPGLCGVIDAPARKAAMSTTSNSLLSLAKIFQDGMASNSPRAAAFQTMYGVREILALYYLSLALQPSPSTANNVGILLASVQQTAPSRRIPTSNANQLLLPGVTPGSGIALALAYYEYGLRLDSKHAHLYTNLGSLLKDIGHLQHAIRMYENAVSCDQNFDIALANLANAVKDQGRIADAITYYKRAVDASPDFAEAVCGLANALNSVCGWTARGGIADEAGKRDRWHVGADGMLKDASLPGAKSDGWIKRVVDLVEKQLGDGQDWGKGLMDANFVRSILDSLPTITGASGKELDVRGKALYEVFKEWTKEKWQGARMIRLVERIMKRLTWQWYQDKYVVPKARPTSAYTRPLLPSNLTIPAAPTVLPFHTFTCPMSAKQIRSISLRNGWRISTSALKAPWLPSTVHPPPAPPNPYLKVGYLSSDFNNHPLAHLMQSVFGLHDQTRVRAICYATTASDNSAHRKQIEDEAPEFNDASNWSTEKLVKKIADDGIHILVNLNGYTRGARNEVFAARPAPIQMSFMGFAGTLGAEWCDYLLADETAVPRDTLRPWRRNVDVEDVLQDETNDGENEDWIYGENIIYCRDTFFCCDHRQSAPDAKEKQLPWGEELERRWAMRKEIFPTLEDDAIILGNFNQLYKIEPTTFRTWLRILSRVPKAILWLLRFPDLGEQYLRKTAELWAGAEVASRIRFTNVAPKHLHISRARVCDLFLDTPECNAHTTAADTLWSGTPLLTLPRWQYKMCSRMAASILKGALPKGREGDRAAGELIAANEQEYEDYAVRLAAGLRYEGKVPVGRLAELRKMLYEARWTSALFDTRRWVRDLEEAYGIAWEKWVKGEGGDITLE